MPLKLPRLPGNKRLINPDGTPTIAFSSWWQSVVQQVETSINGIQAALDAADAANAAADVATAAAADASAAAGSAQTAADSTTSEQSIANSGIINYTSPAIKAFISGNITVANHDRLYGNPTLNPTVAVTGDNFATPFVADDIVFIFYDDLTRAGGAVTYQTSLDSSDALQSGNRHSVGSVSIPTVGTTDGTPVLPRGVT